LAEDSKKKEVFIQAESLFDKKEFVAACPLYLELSEKKPQDMLLAFKCGICLTCGGKVFIFAYESFLILFQNFMFVVPASCRGSQVPGGPEISPKFPKRILYAGAKFAASN
jgi:hypothetical protein